MFSLLYQLLLIAVGAFQLWFWFVLVPQLSHTPECQEYGFFFARIRLNGAAFRGLNIAVHLGIMVVCLVDLVVLLRGWGNSGKSRELVQEQRAKVLQKAYQSANFIVISVIIVGTELTIWWNEIRDINSVSTAAQTIALIIGLGSFIRVFYVYCREHYKGRCCLWGSEPEPGTPPISGQYAAPLGRVQLLSAPVSQDVKLPSTRTIEIDGEGKTLARRNKDEDEEIIVGDGEIR
jgi:hypothetical protein